MICLVTDRRRVMAGSPDGWRDCLIEQARFAVDAGIDLVQVRGARPRSGSPGGPGGFHPANHGKGSATTLVVVNDRLDVAVACAADGVHLRGDSIAVADARQLAPVGFLVGRSVHSVEEAVLAADADYLIAGTVFPSESKPSATSWLGVDGLERIVRAVRTPVLAIGGVTADRLDDVASTGVAGVAAIGLFLGAAGSAARGSVGGCRAISLHDRVTRLHARFDSVHMRP